MDLTPFLDLGSFGLLAFLVLKVFSNIEKHMQHQVEAQHQTSKVLAELVLQVSLLTGVAGISTQHSSKRAQER